MKKLYVKEEVTDFLLYTSSNGKTKVEVIVNNETVWLIPKSNAQLFGIQVSAVSKHLQ